VSSLYSLFVHRYCCSPISCSLKNNWSLLLLCVTLSLESTPFSSSSTAFWYQFLHFRLICSYIHHFFLFWFTTDFWWPHPQRWKVVKLWQCNNVVSTFHFLFYKLTFVLVLALVHLCITRYMTFEVPGFADFKDVIGGGKIESCDPDHAR